MKKLKKILATGLCLCACVFSTIMFNGCKKKEPTDELITDLQTIQLVIDTITDVSTKTNALTEPQIQSMSNILGNSNIGIPYTDYETLNLENYEAWSIYKEIDDLLDMSAIYMDAFKGENLSSNKTYKHTLIFEDEDPYDGIDEQTEIVNTYFKIIKSKTYVNVCFKQEDDDNSIGFVMKVNFNSDIKWTSFEMIEIEFEVAQPELKEFDYFFIEQTETETRLYDRVIKATSDYKYNDIDEVLNKMIFLDCSAESNLTENQTKAKEYINSLNLSSYNFDVSNFVVVDFDIYQYI